MGSKRKNLSSALRLETCLFGGYSSVHFNDQKLHIAYQNRVFKIMI